jgi:D-arginine dehydrogenase
MPDDSVFDVAIVGAGIAGASLAWRLAPHLHVALLEREPQPGYHSTGRSAAMFIESYGPPAVRALTRASRAFYESPPPSFADMPLLAPRGALYLALPGQEPQLDETRAELEAAGCVLKQLTRDEVLERVPCLRSEAVYAALLDDDAQDIDVHALHQGFLRGLRGQGGVLRTSAGLQGAARSGAGANVHWELRLAEGNAIRCRHVVNAAGAWADEVAALFGAALVGLVPCRRSAFTFKAPDGVDASRWPAVVGIDESFYFKPDAGQLLGSPANADATFPHDVMPEELDIATGIARIEGVSTLQIRRPSSTWAGLRSFVRDGELVIGWDDACDGFFWLAAQGGYGIQSAAGASELAAALLRGAPLPDELLRHRVDPRALSPLRLR